MFLRSFAVALLNLVAATSAGVVKNFEPISAPSAGDTIAPGFNFTIKWDPSAAYYPGHMRISLVRGDSLDDLSTPVPIAESVETDEPAYVWQVGDDLSEGDNYWLMVTYLKDQDIVNYSPQFSLSTKSSGSSSSSSSGPSSSTPVGTGTATSPETSTLTSTAAPTGLSGTGIATTPPLSTSTQPGAAEHAAPSAFALLAVAAIGMAAL